MDFSNREAQPHTVAPGPQPTAIRSQNPGLINSNRVPQPKHTEEEKGDWTRIVTLILVAALVILLCGLIALINSSNNRTKAAALNTESQNVKADKLQAVFLNNNQVYFGKIKNLNNKYLVLGSIYYLQTTNTGASGAVANSNVTLVKLGCELHEPYDQLIINRDQVTFWENLQDDGQVAKAVASFQKQNPNGQKCVDQSKAAGGSGNSAQPASSNSSTTPAPAAKR